MIWTGLSFIVLGHRDGRVLHLPGLYGFARRDAEHGALLLFAGQADDLTQAAGPAHPQWEEALRLAWTKCTCTSACHAASTGCSS